MNILSKLDRGFAPKRLAADYDVCEATITYIKKQKLHILEASRSLQRKNTRKSDFPEMEAESHS